MTVSTIPTSRLFLHQWLRTAGKMRLLCPQHYKLLPRRESSKRTPDRKAAALRTQAQGHSHSTQSENSRTGCSYIPGLQATRPLPYCSHLLAYFPPWVDRVHNPLRLTYTPHSKIRHTTHLAATPSDAANPDRAEAH